MRVEPCLLRLTDGWQLWSVGGLRFAGLPASRVLELAGVDDGDGFAPSEAVTAAVERFARDPWCLEAVTQQNPALVENWLGDYARRLGSGDAALSRRARKDATIALYLQRYATKNDTIGFFGPVAWVGFCPDQARAAALSPPVELARRTHLEPWAMTALAAAWESDPDLLACLPVRRDPSTLLEGRRLRFPRRPALDLTAEEAAVLALCGEPASPAGILDGLRDAHPDQGFDDVAEVRSILARLDRAGAVTWGFHLPLDERMDAHLLEQLEAASCREVGERCAAPLRRLRAGLDAVTAAAGDPERLLEALRTVERGYEAAIGTAARRSKPESQVGRGLVWQDVLQTWDLTIGAGPLERAAPVLGLVLDTCRWLTWSVARGVEDAGARLLLAAPGGSIPFGRLLLELSPELRGEPGTTLDRVVRDMQARAGAILGPAREARVELALEDVGGPWRAAFTAPGPGWTAARLHSPDLLLAAADPAALDRGEFRWVLGEVHVAVNTLENRCFAVNEERPGTLAALMERSLPPGVRYVPAFPRSWPDVSARAYPPLAIDVPGRSVHWSLEAADTLPLAVPRVPAAAMDVTLADGGRPLVRCHQRPGFTAPLVEVIGELLSFLVGNAFQLLPARPHTGRITVDGFVLRRESWSLAARDLRAAGSEEGLARLLRDRGLPRFTFARLPGEPKPVLCDLRNQPLLRAIGRLLQRGADEGDGDVRFDEMLPAFGELWLRDAAGEGHTSELRVVAVDTS